jgi:NAD(P)-dependent dehydrogenase (short-subunit alcohol dehydrogenase family)
MNTRGQLAGKGALVTGAAGAIGRAISRCFLAEGSDLVLVDNHRERLEQFAAELGSQFSRSSFRTVQADVRDTQAVRQACAIALEAFGRLDILVNNAAVTQIKTIDTLSDEDIDLIIDTNLKGYIKCAREAVRIMKEQKIKGSLLFVSSKNGLVGASDKSLYNASKGGEINLARGLAKELGAFGIRVNTLCPDAVLRGSALWEKGGGYLEGTAKSYGISIEEIPQFYRQRCALGTAIEPEDVANAALFLVSDRASKMTGNILTVDGGVAYVR